MLGTGEVALLVALTVIMIRPHQLPDLARTCGAAWMRVRRAMGEIERTFEETLSEHHQGPPSA